jgi:hypothetical protein
VFYGGGVLRKWRATERDSIDGIVTYKSKEGKVDYILDYESTHKGYDTWGIEISRGGKTEDEFSVYLMLKVKHGLDDNMVLEMAEARIKKLLNEVRP